ncbi:MAG TPA: cell division protein ZipA C-terminal FtsZ-binding domain-containing protein [Burkholderiales bacterium]|nr:cell division protein ZipA C-terminal FtsZ-binding domain-containing protein [Burkholderiales bacterium]
MSELQTGLLIISAVIVIAVLVYNKIEQQRLRKTTEAAFASTHEDVLLSTQAASMPEAPRRLDESAADDRIEHTLGDYRIGSEPIEMPMQSKHQDSPTDASRLVQVLQSTALTADIDFIINLAFARERSGAQIAEAAQRLGAATVRKPVHWEGFDTASQSWQPIHSGHTYRNARVGIQLANRSGPADEIELAAFFASIGEIAEALNAHLEAEPIAEAKQRALGLDAFCADHDIQIGLSVLGREGQTLQGTKIRALAEANGCILARDGRFHKLSEQGAMLYALSNTEPMPFHAETLKTLSTRGVGLTLDVPRAPGTPATFRAYIDFARQLTQALGGVLVDDDRKAISDAAIEQIALQLNAIHHAMAARGIHAGSPIALRLFA